MNKTISCICSILPIVCIVLGFGGMVIYAVIAGDTDVNLFIMFTLLAVELVGVIMCWVDIIWFMIKAVQSKTLDTTMKIVWCVLIYMFNIFVFPIFWLVYIRKEQS